MCFYVYLIIARNSTKHITYVGYCKNVEKRLKLHNSSKGAKFTKGKKWVLVYKKGYSDKKSAMRGEYKLKRDYKLRKHMKDEFLLNQ